MTKTQLILSNNPTPLDVYNAMDYLVEEFERLMKKLNKNVEFKKLLIGEKVEKVYSKLMEGQIKVAEKDNDAEYVVLNPNLIFDTPVLTCNDTNITTHQDMFDYLASNFIKQNDTIKYDSVQNKKFMLNNLVSVKELSLLSTDTVFKKNTEGNYFVSSAKYKIH